MLFENLNYNKSPRDIIIKIDFKNLFRLSKDLKMGEHGMGSEMGVNGCTLKVLRPCRRGGRSSSCNRYGMAQN